MLDKLVVPLQRKKEEKGLKSDSTISFHNAKQKGIFPSWP